MSQVPVVTVATDKAEYVQGDAVVVTFTVEGDTRDDPQTRTITWAGHDDEGNAVHGTTVVVTHVLVADGFTLDSVAWEGGAAFAVSGLVAAGVA